MMEFEKVEAVAPSVRRTFLSIGVLVVAAAILSGCATPGRPYGYGGVSVVPGGEEKVAFDVPAFAGTTPLRVRYVDEWEQEEYTLYQGSGGAQAEIILANAGRYGEPPELGDEVDLEFSLLTQQSVQTWNMAKSAGLSFSETVSVDGGKLPYFLTPFDRKDTGQSCFGFHAEWNRDIWDQRWSRYDSQMFGYYCAPKGQALTKEAMVKTLDRLHLIGVTTPASVASRLGGKKQQWTNAPLPHSPEALAQVTRGVDGKGRTGNPGFPFLMARPYRIPGGGDADRN